LFCVPKAAVLHGKRAYIASQNSRFCKVKVVLLLFYTVFFTKTKYL